MSLGLSLWYVVPRNDQLQQYEKDATPFAPRLTGNGRHWKASLLVYMDASIRLLCPAAWGLQQLPVPGREW